MSQAFSPFRVLVEHTVTRFSFTFFSLIREETTGKENLSLTNLLLRVPIEEDHSLEGSLLRVGTLR